MSLLRDVLTCHDASVIPLDARQADYSRVGEEQLPRNPLFEVNSIRTAVQVFPLGAPSKPNLSFFPNVIPLTSERERLK